jgi:hypothetical protein
MGRDVHHFERQHFIRTPKTKQRALSRRNIIKLVSVKLKLNSTPAEIMSFINEKGTNDAMAVITLPQISIPFRMFPSGSVRVSKSRNMDGLCA